MLETGLLMFRHQLVYDSVTGNIEPLNEIDYDKFSTLSKGEIDELIGVQCFANVDPEAWYNCLYDIGSGELLELGDDDVGVVADEAASSQQPRPQPQQPRPQQRADWPSGAPTTQWTVAELKAYLQHHGQTASGNKDPLLARAVGVHGMPKAHFNLRGNLGAMSKDRAKLEASMWDIIDGDEHVWEEVPVGDRGAARDVVPVMPRAVIKE